MLARVILILTKDFKRARKLIKQSKMQGVKRKQLE